MGSEPAGSVAGTPGERLRVERERRGFSTQKVAEALHIDVWVVEALESGRHSSLGAPVYVKGHLRKYATLLGLDADALVSACTEQADPPLVRLRPQVRTRRPLHLPIKQMLIGVLVLIVAAAAVWGYRTWRARAVPTPATAMPRQAAAAPVMLAGRAGADAPPASELATQRSVASAPATLRATASSGVPEARSRPAQQNVRVRLSFSADSWVELYDADQRRIFFDLGVANSARSFTVAAPARVFLGYADAVQLELDGRPVTLGEELRRDNGAHFTIDARGRLDPAGSLGRR